MARAEDAKAARLRETRTLHRNPESVRDGLFVSHPFFDARDLLQVRYEMVRRVQVDHQPIARTAEDFGVSRPTVYVAERRFRQSGLRGLLDLKSGPKGPWKAQSEVLGFVSETLAKEGHIPYRELARRVEAKFGKRIDPSTLFRALKAREKKRRSRGLPRSPRTR